MNQHGFSLLEMTVVLALLMIILSLSLSFSWRMLDSTITKLEFDNLYLLFMHLQRQALVDHQTHVIQFDPSHNRYWWDNHEYTLPQSVIFGTIPRAGSPSNPQRPISASITFPGNKVTFLPNGHIQPGTCYLTDKTQSILYALTCPISGISYIRRYQFDTTWHTIS